MATRDIRTSTQDTVCDVCGRTLLRGEDADVYLDGAARRSVCELCKDRALHAGWVREGTVTGYDGSPAPPDRRRSLLARLWGRREQNDPIASGPSLRDDLDGHAWSTSATREEHEEPEHEHEPAPRPAPARSRPSPGQGRGGRGRDHNDAPPPREPRHIRAVPTSVEHKIASAVEFFNQSDHPRTVAGVARSLGPPAACVRPLAGSSSLVCLTISWELCWYRYEVDLSDEMPSVRVAGQGYELSELPDEELEGNAVADERGALHLNA